MRRRDFIRACSLPALGLTVFGCHTYPALVFDKKTRGDVENQHKANLGDLCYRNPILAGNYADASVVRVGQDYYMTHSGSGTPTLLIWHSRDLVNWRPIGHALTKYIGDIWAPDLVYYKELFYLYIPVVQHRPYGNRKFKNFVLTAEEPAGHWSKPIDLGVDGYIDPGHVADKQGEVIFKNFRYRGLD